MFRNFLKCYDQFRISGVSLKITPQYTTSTSEMANYYYRWNRDGDRSSMLNGIVAEGEPDINNVRAIGAY